ncbi:uncharacterized protein K452DRAFT_161191 [Aplosporella prunicola CBS 121167]|uniref:Uncharacterized protein n=1 Tax=Aplosporella prunicola CBS 121167 TaxID=1176127 RepID=A0A6A6BK95_9PEZI|nr:uncharacterized protein K452DRAFT_161191 [Aplosporella prunicola CBS 121167]KAF2143704.1 hypothetical protein K452DRAFT_161191 [Aplosporella prunicola CBS 121167]
MPAPTCPADHRCSSYDHDAPPPPPPPPPPTRPPTNGLPPSLPLPRTALKHSRPQSTPAAHQRAPDFWGDEKKARQLVATTNQTNQPIHTYCTRTRTPPL